MSVRVHTTDVTTVAVEVVDHDRLIEVFEGVYDHDDIQHALIIEDAGNQEAMVLVGTDAELLAFTNNIREQLGLIDAVFNPEAEA